ncbi:hypothetical protein Tco_0729010 [Tanacetum coccineum]|uniref:Uncharacterized protein n=1 Tax=Tanacetum coccineum TaxID=301880 RepID=A0ABQ4YMP9_9ASTR
MIPRGSLRHSEGSGRGFTGKLLAFLLRCSQLREVSIRLLTASSLPSFQTLGFFYINCFLNLLISKIALEALEVSFDVIVLKFKFALDTSSASNAIFEINKLRKQLQGKDDTIRNLETQINITRMLNVGSTEEKLSALTAENTKLKAQVTGKTSSGPSTSVTNQVLDHRNVTLRFLRVKKPLLEPAKTVPKRGPSEIIVLCRIKVCGNAGRDIRSKTPTQKGNGNPSERSWNINQLANLLLRSKASVDSPLEAISHYLGSYPSLGSWNLLEFAT